MRDVHLVEFINRYFLLFHEGMGIDVEGYGDIGMPQYLAERLDIDAQLQRSCSKGMSDRVKFTVFDLCTFQYLLYSFGRCADPWVFRSRKEHSSFQF